MSFATNRDKLRLHYEEAGEGTPILFIHEFGGDHRSWEAQMRFFARKHRCIAYAARGYTPSDIPPSADAYSYKHFVNDAVDMLDHLRIAKAHIVGLSMGGYTALHFGLNHADRALSLTLAGTGSGSERDRQDEFRKGAEAQAKQFETLGAEQMVKSFGLGPGRIPLLVKDPRGYAEFAAQFAQHDSRGAASVMRGFQGQRPSIYDFEDAIRGVTLPTLIVVGDEDDACIEPSLFLKRAIATSGLAMFPKTGHGVNLEEPDLFNRTLGDFFSLAEAGRWPPRDPRSVRK
jgi:3-oxoadipate enol-lactonase